MIPLAVPIAFAVLALVAWGYDARARRAYEATLSAAEKRQFRALRRVHPARWRGLMALKDAETAVAASPDRELQAAKRTTRSRNPKRRAKRDQNKPRRSKSGAK
jgi:hypothetical protein